MSYAKYNSIALTTASGADQLFKIFQQVIKLLSHAVDFIEQQNNIKAYETLAAASNILTMVADEIANDEISQENIIKQMIDFLYLTASKINEVIPLMSVSAIREILETFTKVYISLEKATQEESN